MATTHYDFPTVNGTDAIDGVNAINGLANAVDTALYAVDAAVIAQEGDIEEAKTNASSASAAASAASTNATAAQQTATAAQQTATAANQTASSAAAGVNALAAKFNLTNNASVSSGLGITGATYKFTLSQNDDGSIFKFYGNIIGTAATTTTTRVAIPGLNMYGTATGLMLRNVPSSAYVVNSAGYVNRFESSGTATSGFAIEFAVGTNGMIYIFPSTSSSAYSSSGKFIYGWIWPCLYFNTSFGDVVME